MFFCSRLQRACSSMHNIIILLYKCDLLSPSMISLTYWRVWVNWISLWPRGMDFPIHPFSAVYGPEHNICILLLQNHFLQYSANIFDSDLNSCSPQSMSHFLIPTSPLVHGQLVIDQLWHVPSSKTLPEDLWTEWYELALANIRRHDHCLNWFWYVVLFEWRLSYNDVLGKIVLFYPNFTSEK